MGRRGSGERRCEAWSRSDLISSIPGFSRSGRPRESGLTRGEAAGARVPLLRDSPLIYRLFAQAAKAQHVARRWDLGKNFCAPAKRRELRKSQMVEANRGAEGAMFVSFPEKQVPLSADVGLSPRKVVASCSLRLKGAWKLLLRKHAQDSQQQSCVGAKTTNSLVAPEI